MEDTIKMFDSINAIVESEKPHEEKVEQLLAMIASINRGIFEVVLKLRNREAPQ